MGTKKAAGSSFPIAAMIFLALVSGLVVGGSFEVIKHWSLPVSVAPVFGFKGGFTWGLIAGAFSGLVLGFLTDDSHFEEQAN